MKKKWGKDFDINLLDWIDISKLDFILLACFIRLQWQYFQGFEQKKGSSQVRSSATQLLLEARRENPDQFKSYHSLL